MAQGKVCLAADVSVVAMTPDLGAEIRGIDLSAPLSDACFARILEIFHRYCVVFVREQDLDPRLLVRFASRFGEPHLTPADEQPLPGLPQVSVLCGSAPDGHSAASVEPAYWHSDRSYEPVPPAVTLLYARQGGDGGYAEFINMYSVLNLLPPQKRLLVQKLRGLHHAPAPEADENEAASVQQQTAEHPLVRMHPETGRTALYLAKEVVVRAAGMREDDGRKLIEQLEWFATQPRFVYAHRWRRGDLLIWDNRCTLHRMSAFQAKHDRMLYRIRIKGEVPVAG